MRALSFLLAATCAFAQPVAISSGRISGKDLGDVRAYLGIPYAAPPVGSLRWAPPQPPASWEGVRAMDHYGNVCMQPKATAANEPTPMSEDCLTLNVWAPKDARTAAVMVWIHGGAFIEGSGALAIYEGAGLARQGVVVVTINYRMGDFGFFAHSELKGETNFGLQDQIAALHWVQRNIAAFGGDPRNVTIFGESAGGSSVNYLMLAPQARGLFAKAIAESGGAHAHAQTLAELEREDATRATQWHAARLAELRAVPSDTIEAAPRRMALGLGGPVLDGKFVAEDIPAAFAEGKQAPVPFLLGANSNEASLMGPFGISAGQILAVAAAAGDKLRQFYGDDQQKAAQGLFTDGVFLAPARYLAAQMERVHQPSYLYFFSYVLERRRAQSPGVAHGGEIPFVFGSFPALLSRILSPADRQFADTVGAAWVQFAKTGNPNRTGLPEWPAYTAATDRSLEWGSPIAVRQHFRAEQLDLLTAATLSRAR